jgi:hypothetical protein
MRKRSNYRKDYLRGLAERLLAIHIASLRVGELEQMLREPEFASQHDYAAESAIAEDVHTLITSGRITIRLDPALNFSWGDE